MFNRLKSQLRSAVSVYRDLTGASSEDTVPAQTVESQQQTLHSDETSAVFTIATSYRSSAQLSGSSIVRVWFECVQDAGVRFKLDLSSGQVSEVENWSAELLMPGQEAIDPEPLSVWGIDSMDDRVNIIMQVDAFDDLFVEGELMAKESHPEVERIISELSNVSVRDIWLECLPALSNRIQT